MQFHFCETQNASLGVAVPWGPDDFRVLVTHRTRSIKREAVFMTAVWFLSEQAKRNFNGRLSRPAIAFRDATFSPPFRIVVSAPKPDQRVLRSHIFWGIARILNQMIKDDAFVGSIWLLQFRGQEVGSISFIGGSDHDLDAQPKLIGSALARPITTGSTADLTPISDGPSIFYGEFLSEQLIMEDIFMSPIAALILLAEMPAQSIFAVFRALYPGYRCIQVWHSDKLPSTMSKEVLIETITSAVHYALGKNNWHGLRGVLKRGGPDGAYVVATGGYHIPLSEQGP
ncbi:MAG: hypothetical protein LQ337_008586 [Flavoplaca oasis]|nr:MAG: hypothetical protein LQ337_008586 [Flavoplaca oasis]